MDVQERTLGRVKWFSDDKGYGFITPLEGADDIFVHYSAIRGGGYRSLIQGQEVEFKLISGDKGLQAQDVQVIG